MKSNAKKSSLKKFNRAKYIFIFLMLLIPVLNFLIFFVYANFKSILFAFQLPDGTFTLKNFEWVFQDMIRGESIFLEAILNTLKFFLLNLLVIFPLSLFLGYFIYKKIFMYKWFRVIFFLPSIISAVVLTTVFKMMIGPDGPLVAILEAMGVSNIPEFLANPNTALSTIMVYCVWTGFGTNIILLGGAFARIPKDTLEQAKLDGVGPFRELFQIMIPMIWPTISTMLIFLVVGLFGAGGPILLLTKGAYNTQTISYWIFEQVNDFKSFNQPAAAGLILTVIGVPIVLVVKKLIEKLGWSVEY